MPLAVIKEKQDTENNSMGEGQKAFPLLILSGTGLKSGGSERKESMPVIEIIIRIILGR